MTKLGALKLEKNEHGHSILRDTSKHGDCGEVVGQIVQRRNALDELQWHYYFWHDRKLSTGYKLREYAVRAARRVWRARC